MVSKVNRKILILAAGRGKRLMPLTRNYPKCLVKIGGRPILFYQLQSLAACGIKDIIMVTGYRSSMIEEYAHKNFPNLRIKFIHNPHYQNTSKLFSWHLAKKNIDGDSIILDSDILFHPKIISIVLSLPPKNNFALFYRNKYGKGDTMVSINDGNVTDIGKDLKLNNANGKFTGIYVFSKKFSSIFFDITEKLLKSNNPNAFGFDVVRKIRDEKKFMLRGLDVSQYPFIEIDYPEEINIAETKILPLIIDALGLKT